MPQQQVQIRIFTKGNVPPFAKEPLLMDALWIMEGSTSSGNATIALHFTDKDNKEYCCETTARIADGMAGSIVAAQLQFRQKPLGAQEGQDYFGFFHRMKGKMKELYFRAPGATEEGWQEYSKDIIIDKMIEV